MTTNLTETFIPLSPQTIMDAVTLRVGDLELMTEYYTSALALNPIEERATRHGTAGSGEEVHRVLGRGDTPLIRLIATPNLPVGSPYDAGLFHTAFLFETKEALAGTVARTARHPLTTNAGCSDHLVSQAFYFTDPEGNGIELYWDRDREHWKYDDLGDVRMDTLRLDPNLFLREHLTEEIWENPNKEPGVIGHVHLQVGELAPAAEFYTSALGFETTLRSFPGALFASAGGYHHHVAMNTWNSLGAGPRAAKLGLAEVAINVPGRTDLDHVTQRLRARGLKFTDNGREVTVSDPWGTRVRLALPVESAEDLLPENN